MSDPHRPGPEDRLGPQDVETFSPAPPAAVQTNASGLSYRQMSQVVARPISWLWPGWIAHGKVTMIAGNPGLGKSQSVLGLAATVSCGGRLPDVVRKRCRESFDKRISILERIADDKLGKGSERPSVRDRIAAIDQLGKHGFGGDTKIIAAQADTPEGHTFTLVLGERGQS